MKMHRKVLWLGVVAAILGWLTPALAEDITEPLILTVRGKTYTASELGIAQEADERQKLRVVEEKINEAILGPIWQKEEFQVSEEELKDFCRRQTPTAEEAGVSFDISNLFEDTWKVWQGDTQKAKEARACATMQISEWKTQKSFFDRYGGRVVIDSFEIPLAFDAVRTFREEQAANGQYIIHDEAIRTVYWERVRMTPKEPLLSEEEGRAAFAEDPAERWKQQLLELSQRMEEKRKSHAEVP